MTKRENETKIKSKFDEDLEIEELNEKCLNAGRIRKALKCDFSMSELVAAMYKETQNKKESLMIEDIIDIYNHKYDTYESYVRATRYLIEECKKRNSETIFKPHDLTIKKSFYIEPCLLSKNTFETAYKLGEKRGKE